MVRAPAPEMMPPMVSAPAVWVLMPTRTARLPARVTAPVPMFRLLLPMNVKSLPIVIAPVEVNVVAALASRPTA